MKLTEHRVGEYFYFHHGWRFLLADAFPLANAVEQWKDKKGFSFYELEYEEDTWSDVTLPHTFNDKDLFKNRIKDAGSGQKRTVAFYRNWFHVPDGHRGHKVILEFERVRQSCYVYVNGTLAGYYEAGVAPFGIDLTKWLVYDKPNLIAIATDNTATRDIDACIAETPNKPDVKPGSYLLPQGSGVDEAYKGVGFFWNCNDFNPSVGGITNSVKIHFKPKVHITLPLYSNLQTKGVYVYGSDFDIEKGTANIHIEAEVSNESGEEVEAELKVLVRTKNKKEVVQFCSDKYRIPWVEERERPISITPEDAYVEEILTDGRKHYIPVEEEEKVKETRIDSIDVSSIEVVASNIPLCFWSISTPYLYEVEVKLYVNGILTDETTVETGFRKVGYDKDKGVLINDIPVWLRGYAQRATNEWAAIGIAPEWLKDQDAKLIRESNANHIRWMHVAAAPADIRSYDRQGVVCTQPAGDKERENFGRQWDQRVELMRDIIIAFRNHPSILFWEAGNNSINQVHMREMRLLKEKLDPNGGRFMGCRTLNTEDVVVESEFVGTMLNRHAARFIAEHGPIMETEYAREEAPRRVWDDFSPPDFDYKTKWLGKGGMKQEGLDYYDITSEELALANARGYSEYFVHRVGGASGKNYYSGCAALCWTDSAQHGRQSYSENGRMSGRVDAVRTKKQSFDVFRVMQSSLPQVKILGHWNYPKEDGINYQYEEKIFNGNYYEVTGKKIYRNPKKKTLYVLGSYEIAKIVLKINDREVGSCENPTDFFVFSFENIDVTESGMIRAYGYNHKGNLIAEDELHTVGKPSKIKLTLHTSPDGLKADGNDLAYVDIEVVDEKGDICPLCYDKIDFTIEGEGIFLGGYNSGRFVSPEKDDNVIHQSHVYAECGTNRVFLRSTRRAGIIKLFAKIDGMEQEHVQWASKKVSLETLTKVEQVGWYEEHETYECWEKTRKSGEIEFSPIPEMDTKKYKKEEKPYCKILINGQEPDTQGVPSINENGSIWGNVRCILDRLAPACSGKFTYEYYEETKKLILRSGTNVVEAQAGRTHLLVNGNENLMDGEPYVTPEGKFVMEVSAIVSYIQDVIAYYDDKVEVFRIEV